MKAILTAVLTSASLASVCGQELPVNAMESMPDAFTKEANRILSKGFCDEVKETGNKLLIPKDYMDENFNSVMYKLVGVEMDYWDSVPYEMWDEMVAETTEEIMNRCRNILPFGSIIGKWECTASVNDLMTSKAKFAFMDDVSFQEDGIGEIVIKGSSIRFGSQSRGDYIIKLTNTYDMYFTRRRAAFTDLSLNPSGRSERLVSSMQEFANKNLIDQATQGSFILFDNIKFEFLDGTQCVREE